MLETMSESPLIHALGWALVSSVWQVAIVASAAALTLRVLAKSDARWRYGVACIALLSMTALPIATAVTGPGFALLGAKDVASDSREVAETAPRPANPDPGPLPVGTHDTVSGNAKPRLSEWLWFGQTNWLALVVLTWCCGVSLSLLRLAGGWILVRRIVGSAGSVGDELAASVSVLALKLHLMRPVRTFQSSAVDTPTVVGWLRPVVLLPLGAITGLTPEQLEAVIAHELAHVRRHDYMINVLQRFAETLLFYHPGVWWISRQIRLEREQCADDLAVAACGDATLYARALRDLEKTRTGKQPALALGATGSALRTRIVRLLGQPDLDNRWSAGWIAVLVIGLLIAIGSGLPDGSRAEAAEPQVTKQPDVTLAVPAGHQIDSVEPTPVTTMSSSGEARTPESEQEQTVPDDASGISDGDDPVHGSQGQAAIGGNEGIRAHLLPVPSIRIGPADSSLVVSSIRFSPMFPETEPASGAPQTRVQSAPVPPASTPGIPPPPPPPPPPPVVRPENVPGQFVPFGPPTAFLGVTVIDHEEPGVLVRAVEPESPAEQAGIETGDVITTFNGASVTGARQFTRMVQETPPGRTAEVTLLREDGTTVSLNVELVERRDMFARIQDLRNFTINLDDRLQDFDQYAHYFPNGGTLRLGLRVEDMTPELREFFGAPSNAGVLVTSVEEDSPAAHAGIQVGDVIVAADGNSVANRRDLIWSAEIDGDAVSVRIVREHTEIEIPVTLDIPPRSWRIAP